MLQLSRQKQPVPYAMDIAARFLTELGRGHYGPIAKALGADTAEIQAAEKAIAALDPHPAGLWSRRSRQSTCGRTYSWWNWTENCGWC